MPKCLFSIWQYLLLDFPVATNEIEGRSEPDESFDLEANKSDIRNGIQILILYISAFLLPTCLSACIANGTIYGPGSAMDSSSQCEYCYCLGGQQRCVKPRCLLPIDGCTPIYENHTCCPVHYNCTRPVISTKSTTTTITPQLQEAKGISSLLIQHFLAIIMKLY